MIECKAVMKIATISSKGQITLPRSLLRELNIRPKQKVFIQRENGAFLITPIKKSITEELAGSLTKYIHPSKLGVPFEEVRRKTQELAAKELAEKWKNQTK